MRMQLAVGLALALTATACGGGGGGGGGYGGDGYGEGGDGYGGGSDYSSGGDETSSSITIVNNSNYVIYRLFMSPTHQDTWGPDQLGSEVIGVGESFTLDNIPCEDYDVKIVDEDGDECVIEAVSICAEDSGWVITNDDLLSCEGYTRADGPIVPGA